MKAVVSVDKAFEMEFLFSREEIRVRMDYNRRLLTGQVTLIAALIAGALSLVGKTSVNPVLFQLTAIAIIWVNAAFLIENTSNNSHISAAAVFMHNVLNTKYKLAQSDRLVYEWELFLSSERQLAKQFLKRAFFLTDAALLLNIMLTAVACCTYYVALRQGSSHLSRLGLVGFVIGLICAAVAYRGHFTANASWKMLVTREQVERLKQTFNGLIQTERI